MYLFWDVVSIDDKSASFQVMAQNLTDNQPSPYPMPNHHSYEALPEAMIKFTDKYMSLGLGEVRDKCNNSGWPGDPGPFHCGLFTPDSNSILL